MAPVLEEGATSRNIYLPEGEWIDQNNGSIHHGPIWLYDYNAPLHILPYFVRSSSSARCVAFKGVIFMLFSIVCMLMKINR